MVRLLILLFVATLVLPLVAGLAAVLVGGAAPLDGGQKLVDAFVRHAWDVPLSAEWRWQVWARTFGVAMLIAGGFALARLRWPYLYVTVLATVIGIWALYHMNRYGWSTASAVGGFWWLAKAYLAVLAVVVAYWVATERERHD